MFREIKYKKNKNKRDKFEYSKQQSCGSEPAKNLRLRSGGPDETCMSINLTPGIIVN